MPQATDIRTSPFSGGFTVVLLKPIAPPDAKKSVIATTPNIIPIQRNRVPLIDMAFKFSDIDVV